MRSGTILLAGVALLVGAAVLTAQQPVAPWHISNVDRLNSVPHGDTAATDKYLHVQVKFEATPDAGKKYKFRVVNERGDEVGSLWGWNNPKSLVIFDGKWDSLVGLYLDGLGHREPLFRTQVATPRVSPPPVLNLPASRYVDRALPYIERALPPVRYVPGTKHIVRGDQVAYRGGNTTHVYRDDRVIHHGGGTRHIYDGDRVIHHGGGTTTHVYHGGGPGEGAGSGAGAGSGSGAGCEDCPPGEGQSPGEATAEGSGEGPGEGECEDCPPGEGKSPGEATAKGPGEGECEDCPPGEGKSPGESMAKGSGSGKGSGGSGTGPGGDCKDCGECEDCKSKKEKTPFRDRGRGPMPSYGGLASMPIKDAPPNPESVPAFVLYVATGEESGPGKIYQVNEHGRVLGVVNLPYTPTGLALHRDHGLVCTMPRDGGHIMKIDDTGKVSTLMEREKDLVHPVDVAVGGNSDSIVVADNISDVLAATNTGGVKPQIYKRLEGQKWSAQNMSIAVTRDKAVIFGTDGDKGIYRFSGNAATTSSSPLLPEAGGVAADPKSLRWAATQSPNQIYVFEGEELIKKLRLPPNKSMYRNGLLSFSPAGSICVAARESDSVSGQPWLLMYNIEEDEIRSLFPWNHETMTDFVVGPRMLWERKSPRAVRSLY